MEGEVGLDGVVVRTEEVGQIRALRLRQPRLTAVDIAGTQEANEEG